jgi:hypothetical protein
MTLLYIVKKLTPTLWY